MPAVAALPWLTISAIAGTAASAATTYSTLTAKRPTAPKITEPPTGPDNTAELDREAQRQAAMRRRTAAAGPSDRSGTLLTGAGGLGGAAPTERKTLLGL